MTKNNDNENNLELAKNYILDGKYKEAKDILNEMEDSGTGDRNYYLGIIHANDNDYKKAENYFLETLSLNKEYIGAYISLAELYNILDRKEDSKFLLEKAHQQDPNNTRIISYLVGIYTNLNDIDNSIKYTRKLLEISEEKDVSHFLITLLEKKSIDLIMIDSDEQKIEEANAYAKEMVSMDEDHPAGYKIMGLIAEKRKDYKLASDYLIKSFQRSQKDSTVLNSLTSCLLKLGDVYNAKISNEKSLEIDPENKTSLQLKKDIENLKNLK